MTRAPTSGPSPAAAPAAAPASWLRGIAAAGLPASSAPLPGQPLDDEDWTRLLQGVRSQRLHGQLVAALEAGLLPATDTQREEATTAHADAMSHCLVSERRLLEVDRVLRDAGVAYRVLKGTAVAHLDYPDPAQRMFGDLDLLAAGDALADAVTALSSLGNERRTPPVRRSFEPRFAKCVEMVAPEGYEVDLHRTLVLEPFGLLIDTADLIAAPETFSLSGTSLPALPQPQRFLNACYHAALGNPTPRLLALRDIAQMIPDDPTAAVAMAARWRGTAVLARALRETAASLTLQLPEAWVAWLEDQRTSDWEEQALATYLTAGRSQTRRTLATLPVLQGPRAKAAYLRALLLPERAFLRARRTTYRGWWRQGSAALRRRRRS